MRAHIAVDPGGVTQQSLAGLVFARRGSLYIFP